MHALALSYVGQSSVVTWGTLDEREALAVSTFFNGLLLRPAQTKQKGATLKSTTGIALNGAFYGGQRNLHQNGPANQSFCLAFSVFAPDLIFDLLTKRTKTARSKKMVQQGCQQNDLQTQIVAPMSSAAAVLWQSFGNSSHELNLFSSHWTKGSPRLSTRFPVD